MRVRFYGLVLALVIPLSGFSKPSDFVVIGQWPKASWLIDSARFPTSFFEMCPVSLDSRDCLRVLMHDYTSGCFHPFRGFKKADVVMSAARYDTAPKGIRRTLKTLGLITEIRKLIESVYPDYYGIQVEKVPFASSDLNTFAFSQARVSPGSFFSRTKFVLILVLNEMEQLIKPTKLQSLRAGILSTLNCGTTFELLRNIEYFLVAPGVSQTRRPSLLSRLWSTAQPFPVEGVEFHRFLDNLLEVAQFQSGASCNWQGTAETRMQNALNQMQ